MNGFTYDQVKTVLTSAEDQDFSVKCVFTCPKTGFTIESVGAMQVDQQKMQADAMKQGYMMAGKSFLLSNILGMVGLQRYAGTISQLFSRLHGGSAQSPVSFNFSEEDKQQAVVGAFTSVGSFFEWDEAAGTFVAKPDAAGATT